MRQHRLGCSPLPRSRLATLRQRPGNESPARTTPLACCPATGWRGVRHWPRLGVSLRPTQQHGRQPGHHVSAQADAVQQSAFDVPCCACRPHRHHRSNSLRHHGFGSLTDPAAAPGCSTAGRLAAGLACSCDWVAGAGCRSRVPTPAGDGSVPLASPHLSTRPRAQDHHARPLTGILARGRSQLCPVGTSLSRRDTRFAPSACHRLRSDDCGNSHAGRRG